MPHKTHFGRRPIAQVVVGLIAAPSLLALDPASLKPEGYVSDFAHAIPAPTKSALEQYCAAVERATGVQTALVTIDSLEGEPIEDFTNDLYRQWGVGKKGKDEGVMLLLAVKDRKSRIEVGYGLEPILPDGFVGSILREMTPALRQSDYGAALLEAAQAMGEKIAASKGVKLDFAPGGARRSRSSGGSGFPIAAILFALILFFLLRRGSGGSRGGGGGSGLGGFVTGMILGNVLGRGGSSAGWGGGGGFGGFDSGGRGGFGGFGGGDSGGGGASGSW